MNYDFYRIDYTICGITLPGTLKILPPSGHRPEQKFAVGDKNGVLQCLSIKDEEPVVQFKTLPGKPITSVQLASGNETHGDKIFAASGNEVKGYTRKGKVFLSIETPLSDTITSMFVIGSDLILCSGRTVSFYKDLVEVNTYICDDRILDLAAFLTPNNSRLRLLVLVANKGAAIIENGQLLTRIPITSGPSRLAVPHSLHSSDIYTFYGASNGSIGLISYEKSLLTSTCLVEGQSLGSVVCLGWFFINANAHLAVGRHDGSVQLYLINMENLSEKPRLKYTYFCGEPVTSIDGGCIGTEENELLVSTFSGRIFALRPGHLSGAAVLSKMSQEALTTRRAKLEAEVVRLEKQTANEREKYQRNTRSVNAGLSTPPLLDLQHELLGATRDGWQETRLMSAVPLDMLFIYSKKKLNMQTDSAAVLSICSSQENSSDFLATVRCQAGTRRVWIRMRLDLESSAVESALVFIYALPAGAPRVARLINVRLPALPYYSQFEDPECEKQTRPWCELRVTGGFSVAELTSWLTEILPGDLPRPAGTVTFARTHTLLGTLLICRYQRGLAVFVSDNISTITTIRNIISKCSVEKGIRAELSHDVPENYCLKSFELLEPLFVLEHKKKNELLLRTAIGALDLDMSMIKTENIEGPILCEDYMQVLENPEEDTNEMHFEELVGTLLQWNNDWKALSLKSESHKSDIENLKILLENCDLKGIKNILYYDSEITASPIQFEF